MRLLIDANNLAYRANSATRRLTRTDGTDVTAVYGTLRMLQGYVRADDESKNPVIQALRDHLGDEAPVQAGQVIMCWDAGKSRYRRDIFPDYKSQRDKKRAEQTDEERQEFFDFLDQMEQLHQSMHMFGVHSLKVQDWEGDDIIALLTNMLDGGPTVIISSDRDMLQLVSDDTFVWSPFKEVLYTPDNFTAEVGISLAQYLEYRVLVGDTSDNINGIKGIGDKKAKTLLMKYTGISAMMADEEVLRKSKVTARLFDDMHIILRNLRLMDLTAVPYADYGLPDAVRSMLDFPVRFDDDAVTRFLMANGFVSLLTGLDRWGSSFKALDMPIAYKQTQGGTNHAKQ